MAIRFLAYEVADLCLGKPPLRSISSSSTTVADALAAIKSSGDNFVGVWSCDRDCVCVGRVCMVDIICYLSREDNLSSPALALKAPVSVLLLPKPNGLVRHVKSSASLLEAIDLMLQGAQNLVVPIKTNPKKKQHQKPPPSPSSTCSTNHHAQEFCWLTQEDVIRFLLSSIALFSSTAALSIDTLAIITTEFLAVKYHSPSLSALSAISRSLIDQTSVAVVDDDGTLIGEISPFTLACCGESTAAAISTLSAGDLMAYIDCGGPPDNILRVVEGRLKERNLKGMIEVLMTSDEFGMEDISNSSDEDDGLASPTTALARWSGSGRCNRCSSYSARMVRRAEAIVCHRASSLVAVMIQAIARRVSYVWVIEEDCRVVGIVTFANMLEVLRASL